MVEIDVRPMTTIECDEWLPQFITSYAHDQARWGGWSEERALEIARAQVRGMLPDGAATAGHRLLIAEDDGRRVGVVWLRVSEDPDDTSAYLCGVEVDAELRGRGYGRAIMVEAEREARRAGATAMRLSVFADNASARGLYESLGFAVTEVVMLKKL